MMRKGLIRGIITAAAGLLLFHGAAMANGYNRIQDIAIPFLTFLLALVYPLPALVPASLAYFIMRKLLSAPAPFFVWSYAGAFLGGEAGIVFSYLFDRKIAGPGWNSYHYTLYPWLILGLSLAGSIILMLATRRKERKA